MTWRSSCPGSGTRETDNSESGRHRSPVRGFRWGAGKVAVRVTTMYSLVVATRNKNKLAELSQACGPDLRLEPIPKEAREVKEGTVSLEENATLKATSAVADLGRPAMADDTGFFVDALDGRPGVLSVRFGGLATDGERRQLVLKLLEGVEPAQRTAHYETVLCLAFPDGKQLVARASVYGTVPLAEQGTGGFGYDAV